MYPNAFDYIRAHTVNEALIALSESGEDCKLLAGGCSLIPMMKLRVAQVSKLIDIGKIEGLRYVREVTGYIEIGALTREAELERSMLLRMKCPILVDTSAVVADPIVRNMGTIGGNLSHGDPANDHAATMVALNAQFIVQGPNGERSISADDFFVDMFETELSNHDVLTGIRIPLQRPDSISGGAYVKIERQVGDLATAATAAHVELREGALSAVRIGLTNVGATVVRASTAESALVGASPNDESVLRAAGELAADGLSPWADVRGSSSYKREMVKVTTYRALKIAIRRALRASDV